ncbi:hypothetical protein LT493_31590 [Streptomyces tricolor]|nr:hypothetical protein [Streptomyces tricolor]
MIALLLVVAGGVAAVRWVRGGDDGPLAGRPRVTDTRAGLSYGVPEGWKHDAAQDKKLIGAFSSQIGNAPAAKSAETGGTVLAGRAGQAVPPRRPGAGDGVGRPLQRRVLLPRPARHPGGVARHHPGRPAGAHRRPAHPGRGGQQPPEDDRGHDPRRAHLLPARTHHRRGGPLGHRGRRRRPRQCHGRLTGAALTPPRRPAGRPAGGPG